jgi:hypothetical protein
MRPHQDQRLSVIDGIVDVFLCAEFASENKQNRRLNQGEAGIDSKGTWHPKVVVPPRKVLFLTPEAPYRPYSPECRWNDATEA